MHLFKVRMLTLIRNKTLIFWSLIFPIVLATFYNIAFKNLNNTDLLETIDIVIIDSLDKDENLISAMENAKSGEINLFNLKIENEENAYKLLNDNEVYGILEFKDNGVKLIVNSSGIRQTITKSFLDTYLQTTSAILELSAIGNGDLNQIISELSNNVSYLDEITEKRIKANIILTYYYSLIGMALIYGGFLGTDNIINLQANMSGKGVRIAVSPAKRFKTLLIYTLCAFLIHLLLMAIFMLYLLLVVKLDIKDKLPYLALVCVLGSLLGISFGSFIAIALKKAKEGVKILITSVTGVLGGFLSGMMVIDMKYIIQTKMPILNFINPVGLISDALHTLNYFGVTARFTLNIIILCIMIIAFTIGTYLFYRRDNYESI